MSRRSAKGPRTEVLLEKLKGVTGNTRIKLPNYIDFEKSELDLSVIRMHIGARMETVKGIKRIKECVTDNMQQDSAAFEGWALIMKTRLNGVKRIELSWQVPTTEADRHYQRFLYRVHKFKMFFSDWFFVAQEDLKDLKIKFDRSSAYTLNVPRGPRDKGDANGCKERSVEQKFVQEGLLKESLKKIAGLSKMGNQLPVGLFDGPVSGKKGKAIFTGQASAIDLWGVNNQGSVLSIFELKLKGNRKVGVLSELFFYSMMMHDLISGAFVFSATKVVGVDPWPADHISNKVKLIKAYILSPTIHPLVFRGTLEILSKATSKVGVTFGHISYELEPEQCSLGCANPEHAN